MTAILQLPPGEGYQRASIILFHAVFGGTKLFVVSISPPCILNALLAMAGPVVGDRI
jgi:hypothetical protein